MQAKGVQRGSRFQPPLLLTPGVSSRQDLDAPITTGTSPTLSLYPIIEH
jgi:hypothetical protein